MSSNETPDISQLSMDSFSSSEDWDRSLMVDRSQSSIAFPAHSSDSDPEEKHEDSNNNGDKKRTLSELLKAHAEKGTDCRLSQDEANRLGEVLGQWINASSSPYEGEDDFFARDDLALTPARTATPTRMRGHSESSKA